jgi:hypothetical protein
VNQTKSLAFLYRIDADGADPEFWPLGNTPLVVGRGDAVDAFVDDDSLSRSHFLIVREGSDFVLVDLNSSNGTWVQGEKVLACKLRSPQLIEAGESRFYFSNAPVIPATLAAVVSLRAVSDARPAALDLV